MTRVTPAHTGNLMTVLGQSLSNEMRSNLYPSPWLPRLIKKVKTTKPSIFNKYSKRWHKSHILCILIKLMIRSSQLIFFTPFT